MLCNPNNPTGTLLQKSQLLPILDCCLQNGIRVILDECFCDMTSEAQQASLLASCTAYPNVFFLKSLTKRFAIPGLRLGYGVCADVAFIEKVRQTGQPWSVNTLAAAAGIAALQDTAYQQQFQTFLEQEQPAFYHALQVIVRTCRNGCCIGTFSFGTVRIMWGWMRRITGQRFAAMQKIRFCYRH